MFLKPSLSLLVLVLTEAVPGTRSNDGAESLLRRASPRDESLSRAAAHAVLVKTAGGFTRTVEAGNDLAV